MDDGIQTDEAGEFENICSDYEYLNTKTSESDLLLLRLSSALERFSCIKRNSTFVSASPCKRNSSSLSTKSWKKLTFFRLIWRRVITKKKKLNEISVPKWTDVKTEDLDHLLNVCYDVIDYLEVRYCIVDQKLPTTKQKKKVSIGDDITASVCTVWDHSKELKFAEIKRNAAIVVGKESEIVSNKFDGIVKEDVTASDGNLPISPTNRENADLLEKGNAMNECIIISVTNPSFNPNFEPDIRSDPFNHRPETENQEANSSDKNAGQSIEEEDEQQNLLSVHVKSGMFGSKETICDPNPCCDCLGHITDLSYSDCSFDAQSLQLGTNKASVSSILLPIHDHENDSSILVDNQTLNLMAQNIVPYADTSLSTILSSSGVSTTLHLTVDNCDTECEGSEEKVVEDDDSSIGCVVKTARANSSFFGDYFQIITQYLFDHFYNPLMKRFF